MLQPLFANVSGERRSAGQCFNEQIATLYSKSWSAGFLKKVLVRDEPWLCTDREVGITVDTLEGALEAIASIRRSGHHRIVAKEAHGLAGHNAIRLWEPDISLAQRQWLARAVQNKRQLVIEPWLERTVDFSVQLEMGAHRLKLCGYTGLINDRKGQFQANWAAPNFSKRVPANVTGLFRDVPNISGKLQHLFADIFSCLEAELREAGFIGPVGIDAFVYRTVEGAYRLKPVVEINPRYTMGRLTLELMQQTCPGSFGMFRLVTRAQARAEGFNDFVDYARSLSQRFPFRLEGNPAQKIRDGALCLNEADQAQVCLGILQIARDAKESMGTLKA